MSDCTKTAFCEEASDTVLISLLAEPFTLDAPSHQTVPMVFASPHSGRHYPESFVRQSRLSSLSLRRSEDAFVDQLFAGAVDIGAPLLAARFPRAFLDANRAPNEIDATMFDGALGVSVDAASARVSAGLGVIPRIVRDGAEIYRTKVPANQAEKRLAAFHRPYHVALAHLVETTLRQFGQVVVVDCHSMPSAAAAPDIILGDRYGLSASPVATRAVERAFEAQGFRVARNVPYAGGYTTQLHGDPARRVHAVQIEINRNLYLDEERVEPAERFGETRARVAAALQGLARIGQLLGCHAELAHAAE